MADIAIHTVLDYLRRLHGVAEATQRSDRDLLRAFANNNDQDAFAVVVTRHAPLVWGVCRRILGHQQDAEDAFQATFLILARRAGSVRWQASVGGWLHTVAQRLALRARKQAEQRRLSEQDRSRTPPIDSSLRDLAAVVDEELRQLPAKYREPLLLHYLEGMTAETAARQLGVSRAAFYNRLNRGRELLRGRLSRQGLSLAAPLLAASLTQGAEAAAPSLVQATLRGLTGSIPERVAALAAEALRTTALLELKLGLALGLLLGVAAGGVAMLTPRTPMAPIPQAVHPAEPPKAEDKAAARLDRHGDPLPEGAVARLGTLRFRVDGEIQKLTFAPDGKMIAVVSGEGVWLLDAINGKPLRHIDSASTLNPRLAFSPDGKRLLGTCEVRGKDRYRRLVRLWETASGRKLLECERNDVRWLGWSAEGQPLAAYLDEKEIRLRELATGRERRFPAQDFLVPLRAKACSCTAGEKFLAAGGGEKGLIHVWNLVDGSERCLVKTGSAYVTSLALSLDERWLASLAQNAAGERSVRLWDTATGKILHTIAADRADVEEVAFAPDGRTLATVGSTEIRLWDATTGRELRRIKSGKGYSGQTIAFSPDSKTLAAAAPPSPAIHRWDTASGALKPQPEGHSNRAGQPAFSPDGKRVATGGSTIRIWNPATGEPLVRIHRGGAPVAFSADGRTLYSCGTSDKLYFDDAASGRASHVVSLEDPDRPKTRQSGLRLCLSDDRARLIVFSADDTHREMLVTGWDVGTRKRLFWRRRIEDAAWNAVSADARIVAAPFAGLRDGPKELEINRGKGAMRLEDLATGEPLLTFPRLEGQTRPLTFSADGRLLISDTCGPLPGEPSKWGDTLRLWDVLTASELLVLPTGNSGFIEAAFSPDGRLLALSARSMEILLWDVRGEKELRHFKGFNAQVTSLGFSPDGRRLVSGLSDSTLLVWDVGAPPAAPIDKLGAEGTAEAWAELAAKDAARAFRARGVLASAPEEAMPLLAKHLHPAQSADAQRLRRLLADLENEQFAVREKAQEELAKLGDLAEPALRQTLANNPSLELRRRVQTVLEHLRGPVTQPEMLQSLRAVAVLEDIGSPPARQLLEKLARGAAEARLTREVKASLRRLDLRKPPP
jgi:RNA polymerase sigma factor (sigma-70 family)